MMITKSRDKVYECILAIVSMMFYLFFAFYDGVVICVDSPSYINMSLTREFLYPALLLIFHNFFGEQYLLYVVILQSLISAFAAWKIAINFRNRFSLGYFSSTVIFFIPVFVSLLNRFVAQRGCMYSNSILTEGLAIPLFLLFICYIYDYIIENTNKALVISAVLSGVLVALRKQMYVTLILLFLGYLFVQIKSREKEGRRWIRSIIKVLTLCIVIFLSVTLLDHTFNYIVRGRFVGHSSDNRFVLTMVFYTAEEEYVEELPEEIQPLYMDIYDTCNEQGYLMNSADDGWYNQVSHFGDNYDFIQIDTMWPKIRQFVEEKYSKDGTEIELITDEITNEMIVSLLPKTAPRIIKALCNNFLSGLVTTIAQRNKVLIYYSIVAYIGYLFLMICYWKKKQRFDDTLKLCLLTLLSIVVNVGLVSAVIFCQTRYTIYNMPLFYASFWILICKMWELRQSEEI